MKAYTPTEESLSASTEPPFQYGESSSVPPELFQNATAATNLADCSESLASLLKEQENSSDDVTYTSSFLEENAQVDPAASALGQEVFAPYPDQWPDDILTHVLKDAFHLFHMFYLSQKH